MRDRRPIRQRLAEYYTEAEIDHWIYAPHPQLDGMSPRHLVDRGDAEQVHGLIDRMDTDPYL